MAWLSWKRLRRWQRLALALPVLVLAIWACALAYLYAREAWEPSKLAYQSHCAGCHGRALEGTDSAPTLLGRELTLTNDYESLMAAMAGGDGAPPQSSDPLRYELLNRQKIEKWSAIRTKNLDSSRRLYSQERLRGTQERPSSRQ